MKLAALLIAIIVLSIAYWRIRVNYDALRMEACLKEFTQRQFNIITRRLIKE